MNGDNVYIELHYPMTHIADTERYCSALRSTHFLLFRLWGIFFVFTLVMLCFQLLAHGLVIVVTAYITNDRNVLMSIHAKSEQMVQDYLW